MDPQVPIAIVGMACRFAGDVSSPESLWKMCVEGRSGVRNHPLFPSTPMKMDMDTDNEPSF